MMHVFERFDTERGELWETIKWDWHTPQKSWKLKCDFRMPCTGVLYIPHPTAEDICVQFAYETPTITLDNYEPGLVHGKNYTQRMHDAYLLLPDTCVFQVAKMTLVCVKDIIDAMEVAVDGRLYLYRPHQLTIDL